MWHQYILLVLTPVVWCQYGGAPMETNQAGYEAAEKCDPPAAPVSSNGGDQLAYSAQDSVAPLSDSPKNKNNKQNDNKNNNKQNDTDNKGQGVGQGVGKDKSSAPTIINVYVTVAQTSGQNVVVAPDAAPQPANDQPRNGGQIGGNEYRHRRYHQ
ncbi:unnamed protein product [Nippostrongylus brasiliensis]|uniref:Secreted protein n=1 Tax=Nippostrongylus brasiliensis TaxID=27835 RepID=A0A0N4Y614_NIPBR|nr:unnamed protein product [Nippostrongylus brasiliensis]